MAMAMATDMVRKKRKNRIQTSYGRIIIDVFGKYIESVGTFTKNKETERYENMNDMLKFYSY